MAFGVSLQLINQTRMESHNNWMHRKQGQLFSTAMILDKKGPWPFNLNRP